MPRGRGAFSVLFVSEAAADEHGGEACCHVFDMARGFGSRRI